MVARALTTWEPVLRSPIARLMLACNLLVLLVTLAGVFLFGELRSGAELTRAQARALRIEGELIASFIAGMAAVTPVHPSGTAPIEMEKADEVLRQIRLPEGLRVRVFGARGDPIADSRALGDRILASDPNDRAEAGRRGFGAMLRIGDMPWPVGFAEAKDHEEELKLALSGRMAGSERFDDGGRILISVTVPIYRISKVIGALTVESDEAHGVIRAYRKSLVPVTLLTIIVVLTTSLYLTFRVATPLRNLARAADGVRTRRSPKLHSVELVRRNDEIGHLARSLEAMTGALTERAEGNARFAADVAHELKNPLTSIRSAVETLAAVEESEVRDQMQDLIRRDVFRMDRLITDISNAGRLEAELASASGKRFDFMRVVADIVDGYRRTQEECNLILNRPLDLEMWVVGDAEALARVVSNLLDNALSFSPEGGTVTVMCRLTLDRKMVIVSIADEGPGIPEEASSKIFQRFYSDRDPKAKQGYSGLGLSIAQHIVLAHGGMIQVGNVIRNGKIAGARLSVHLPSAPDQMPARRRR